MIINIIYYIVIMGGDLEYTLGGLIGAKRRKNFVLSPLKFTFLGGTNPAKSFFWGGEQVSNPHKH